PAQRLRNPLHTSLAVIDVDPRQARSAELGHGRTVPCGLTTRGARLRLGSAGTPTRTGLLGVSISSVGAHAAYPLHIAAPNPGARFLCDRSPTRVGQPHPHPLLRT